MPVTELLGMIAKPGLDITDETTPEGQILDSVWKGVTSEKTGPYRISWGVEVENPSNFWGFVDFDSVEEHAKFNKEIGMGYINKFRGFFEPKPFIAHFAAKPFPLTAVKAPVTEIMLAFFSSTISEEAKEAAAERLSQFVEKGIKKSPDVQGVSFGWAVEKEVPVRGGEEEEGQKGSVLMLVVGWPSVDAHMAFRESEAFKESVGLLQGGDDLIKYDMFHVKCTSIVNETRKA